MAETMVCPICKGRKFILGDGYIDHECKNCNGKGVVEIEKKIEEDSLEASKVAEACSVVIDPIAKKRGRPKKNA